MRTKSLLSVFIIHTEDQRRVDIIDTCLYSKLSVKGFIFYIHTFDEDTLNCDHNMRVFKLISQCSLVVKLYNV